MDYAGSHLRSWSRRGAATVALLGAAIIICAEVFLFAIVSISLFIFDPVLTITAGLFFGLIGFFLHRILGRWSERNAEVVKDASIDTLSVVSEALSTYRETLVLNRREFYIERFESLIGRSAAANANSGFILEIPKYVLESALYLGILVLAAVQFLTQDWAAAAATVAVFLAAGSRIVPALLRLQGAGITIRNAAVQAQPAFFMKQYLSETPCAEPEEESQKSRVIDLIASRYPEFAASVLISDAWLTYRGTESPALCGVNLEVPVGAPCRACRTNGCREVLPCRPCSGCVRARRGRVEVGGMRPRDAINRWPGAIAYVPQSVALVGVGA